MAWFKPKKKKAERKNTAAVKAAGTPAVEGGAVPRHAPAAAPASVGTSPPRFFGILRRPRVTEKATVTAEHGVYVFEVDVRANKKDIAQAVVDLYNVTPEKVSTVPIPSKTVMQKTRRKRGVKTGGKKAYVYLKKGDSIELI